MAKKEFPKALEFLNNAEQRNKSYVHVFATRGEIYAEQKKWDDALRAFTQAIALSPLNPVRYKGAAEILFTRERYKEVVELLTGAVKNGLEFKELYYFLSQAHFFLKEYPKAARFIRSALSIDPENVVFLNQLGICLKHEKQFDEAQKVYNQIIKLDPDNVPALYNKAMLNESKGDLAEAMKLLERAIKKDANFNEAKTKLAELKKKAETPKAG